MKITMQGWNAADEAAFAAVAPVVSAAIKEFGPDATLNALMSHFLSEFLSRASSPYLQATLIGIVNGVAVHGDTFGAPMGRA